MLMSEKETKNETEIIDKDNVEVINRNDVAVIDERVIKLSKPYMFEGKEYLQIDANALENIKAVDMISCNHIMDRQGGFNIMPEMSLEYACLIMSRATGIPIEFFNGLRPKDAIKIKNKVTSFFYGQD